MKLPLSSRKARPNPHVTAAIAGGANTAVVPLSWSDIEAAEGQRDWSLHDAQIEWCQSNGLKICSGPLLQIDKWSLPDWMYLWGEDDDEQFRNCEAEHIEAVVNRYRGKVQLWQCAARLNINNDFGQGEEERLNRLLADLAGLYDQMSGSLELQIQPLPLTPFLFRAVRVWREAAHYKGLEWQVDIPDALPTIAADEDRLAQVVGNLLSNAIKYTPPDNAVSVSAGCQGNEVWIRVSDTGVGIAQEDIAHIFTPFYRGTSNARFADGMGLGLSIAYDLVAAHGGRLTVVSSSGAGSQFTILLPNSTP